MNREREQKEREELLTRRFTTNANTTNFRGGGDTQINLGGDDYQYYQSEEKKLHGFHRNIDDMLSTGGAVMNALRDQASTLRGARSRLMEVDSFIGLSNSVMRLIEKRSFSDKFILFGGMIIFVIFMFLIWKYLT